jgi:hypothetical protein
LALQVTPVFVVFDALAVFFVFVKRTFVVGISVFVPFPVALFEAVNELTFVKSPVAPFVFSLTVGLSVFVLADEFVAVRERLFSETLFTKVFECALINA